MNKKEVLDGMSIGELQNVIYEKQKEEAIKKYGTVRETEFKISELEELKAESHDHLYHVVVEDGSEGWEVIVEVDRNIDYDGDMEDVVEDNIVNYMFENGYYQSGDIENIRIDEICRYSRPIFRIQ
jgi:hypothetical protein